MRDYFKNYFIVIYVLLIFATLVGLIIAPVYLAEKFNNTDFYYLFIISFLSPPLLYSELERITKS